MNKKQDTVLVDSGLKAYILQQINQFEDMFPTDTEIVVEQKNVAKMIKKLVKEEAVDPDFKANYCYTITIRDDGSTITSYGLADDPYSCVRIAKEKMLAQLYQIQDENISNQDHLAEVDQYINPQNTTKH